MKKTLLLFLCTLPLLAGNLALQEGFVAAHTEMVMDKTIDPLNNRLRTDLNMDSDDISSLKGTISVEMDFFSSDNSDRDKEMYETLDSSAFPLAPIRCPRSPRARVKILTPCQGYWIFTA